jgi:hypothetical protein
MAALTRWQTTEALCLQPVNRKRTDIVRLLLDRGVPVDAVRFETVCYSADPELIQLFLDRGANPIAGYPLYRGFQNCLKPVISVYKANIQAMPALQVQADMALCDFAKEGNLRGVSLLLWAGARPDVEIPQDDPKAEFSGSCALEEAVRAGRLNVLKRMQLEHQAAEIVFLERLLATPTMRSCSACRFAHLKS